MINTLSFQSIFPYTVNDNPAGGVGAHVSGRSAGDMLGTGDTPDFAEDSAIDYILGVAL